MARRKTVKTKSSIKTPPACPECGSTEVIPVLHGPATPSLRRALKKGQAVLANREEWEGMTEWYCKTCGCDWSGHWRRFKRARAM